MKTRVAQLISVHKEGKGYEVEVMFTLDIIQGVLE
jgi:hypothetical protein